MATLREYILSQSTLASGSTVREHILNPSSGGDGWGGDECVECEDCGDSGNYGGYGETVVVSGEITVDVNEIQINATTTDAVKATVGLNNTVMVQALNTISVSVSEEIIKVGVCE